MRLDDDQARSRLVAHVHGVLCTLHPQRGTDAVPCVYVADAGGWVGVPVDTVKAKSSTRLQRERNLEADPRATLLVEHWDPDDWTRLWWVRAGLRWEPEPPADVVTGLAALLAGTVPQYADRPFLRVLAFRVADLTGWSATPRG